MSQMQIKITVSPENLNQVLAAVRSAGLRHVEIDQFADSCQISMALMAGDVSHMLGVVTAAQAKAAKPEPSYQARPRARRRNRGNYRTLKAFANGRPRNGSGQFVPMG